MCLLFKSFRFMMHTSVVLLGTHNRSWYIHMCEFFIFCFSTRHFIDLTYKYILKLLPPLSSPLELFFIKYTSIWWPRLENVADGVNDDFINMAAPSTLKEAHNVSDSSPGKFLSIDEWSTLVPPLQMLLKYRALLLSYESYYYWVFNLKKAHVF